MASLGTWAYLLANAPVEVADGRGRTLTYTANMSGTAGGYAGTIPMYGPDGGDGPVCIRGTGIAGYSADIVLAIWFPWQDPSGPPSVTITRYVSGGHVYQRVTVNVLGVEDYTDTLLASDKNHWLATESASISASIDLDEYTVIAFGDPTVYVYVEGMPYPVFGGNGMPDGPPGLTRSFFEKMRVGGNIVVTANGVTVSVPIASADYFTNYGVTYNLAGTASNVDGGGSISVQWNGGNGTNPGFPTQTYTDPGDGVLTGSATVTTGAGASGFTVSASTSNVTVTDGCDTGSAASFETTGTISPSIERWYRARLRCADQPHPGGLSLSCDAGSSAFSSGSASVFQRIRFWSFQAKCNGIYGPFSGSPDTYASARMWLSGMAQTGAVDDPELNDRDDRHDHRLDILGTAWEAGTLTHAASVEVLSAGDELWSGQASSSGSGIVLDDSHLTAAASLTYPKSCWEAYAKFTLPLTLTASADRVVTINLSNDQISKEFEVTVPHGTTVSDAIDSQRPLNVPSGFNVDRRSSRYPLLDQVGGTDPWGPLAASMDEGHNLDDVEGHDDDPDSVKGWLWGAGWVNTVTVGCALESGESLTVGALTLVKDSSSLTLANGFTAGPTGYDGMKRLGFERAVAEGAEVARVTGDTHAVIKVDGRWLDTPSVWRRIPAVGSTGPVFITLTGFGALWNAFQGLTWTAGADPDCPYVDNSAYGLYLQGVGGIAAYAADGTITWGDAFEETFGSTEAQEQIGDVNDYPGMGIPWRADGNYGVPTVYGGYKQTRSWAEGAVYDPDTGLPLSGVTISTTDDASGTSSGTGTTDSYGRYRTTAPFWRGEKGHAIVSPSYTDDPRKAFNRRKIRAAFRAIQLLAKNALCVLHDRGGTYWRATIDSDGKLRVRTALLGGPKLGWFTTAVVSDNSQDREACLTLDPNTQRATLLWTRDDGIYESHSDSDGAFWSDPVSVISDGSYPRQRHDAEGNSLRVAIVDDGLGGAGKLVGQYRGVGDTAWSSTFDLKDTSGTILRPHADYPGYDLAPGHTTDARWSLALRLDGDSGVTDWFSVDDGQKYASAS
jgi:hypothetical protein